MKSKFCSVVKSASRALTRQRLSTAGRLASICQGIQGQGEELPARQYQETRHPRLDKEITKSPCFRGSRGNRYVPLETKAFQGTAGGSARIDKRSHNLLQSRSSGSVEFMCWGSPLIQKDKLSTGINTRGCFLVGVFNVTLVRSQFFRVSMATS